MDVLICQFIKSFEINRYEVRFVHLALYEVFPSGHFSSKFHPQIQNWVY
jgi:hypothetical protein